jgi:hypothetical protein
MVQFSIQYNKHGRASVMCSFILVFFQVFCGLKTLLIMPVIFFFFLELNLVVTSGYYFLCRKLSQNC